MAVQMNGTTWTCRCRRSVVRTERDTPCFRKMWLRTHTIRGTEVSSFVIWEIVHDSDGPPREDLSGTRLSIPDDTPDDRLAEELVLAVVAMASVCEIMES